MLNKIKKLIEEMSNFEYALLVLNILVCCIGVIHLALYAVMAVDLKDEVIKLKEENQELRWENENNYMYCSNE
jgi:hypothetical protein